MRLLVDTNVYLEFFLKRKNFDTAMKFFLVASERKNQTCITAMALRDFGYVIHKYLHDKEETKRWQLKVYEMTNKVINTTADAAIESIYTENKDYEDSLQMIAAEEAMCDAIITYNKKDYQQSKLPVFTPEEMLDIWRKSQ